MEDKGKPPTFLPCPFCGSDKVVAFRDDGWNVGCTDCSTTVAPFLGAEAEDRQKHIDFWNKRAPLRELEIAREALDRIADPIKFFKASAEKLGAQLGTGSLAYQIGETAFYMRSQSADYLQGVAREALKLMREGPQA